MHRCFRTVDQRGPALLVTLELDTRSFAYFEELRRTYFPPALNRVPAHVMVFHRLPFERVREIALDLESVARGARSFELGVCAPRSIGRGVSYDLASDEALRLQAELARRWRDHLIPQDRERYRPHVVVQNKVDARTANATLATLSAQFEQCTARATGFALWTYRAGSWADKRLYAFD